jgi:hypothetical protein
MQVKVLGAERRRRRSYDEKVRLIEESCRLARLCAASRADMEWHKAYTELPGGFPDTGLSVQAVAPTPIIT